MPIRGSGLLPSLACLFLCGAPATAQLVGLKLHPGAEKKYQANLVARGADRWLVGDAVSGFRYEPETGKIEIPGNEVTIALADAANPDTPIYEGRDKNGALKPISSRSVVVSKKEFSNFMVWDRIQTLTGLRDEYLRKKTEIEAKRKQLAGLKMASPEWFELHRTLLTDVDALCGWLRSTIFSAAAAQWEKAYGGELKKAGAAASKSRLEESKKIAPFTDLARLEAVCHEAGKGGVKWHARQSKHIRIIAHTGIPIESVNNALTLGERIIEGFRTDFIDAFLEPEERDPIPEEMFEEYLFTPEDHDLGAVLWETFYGKKIGEPREKVYKLNRRGRGGRADFVHLCKTETDLDGFLAHTIGHDLADLAFARGQACPAWMGEGFGYWVSFEHLARNSITCFAFSMPTYAKAAEREGLKQTEEGMRAAFLALALSKGPSMSDLMQTPLVSMEAPDLAKAWSVIDWLVTIERKKLKPFLVGACESEKDGRTNIESFRDDAMKVFDVTSGDVYVQIDEIWRRFAASGGGESKKKKT